ncbi:hypothetical protein L7F22_040697 [Adiantum nelumboides]|nr:hypothetical protein [Adiantum nelumboides]
MIPVEDLCKRAAWKAGDQDGGTPFTPLNVSFGPWASSSSGFDPFLLLKVLVACTITCASKSRQRDLETKWHEDYYFVGHGNPGGQHSYRASAFDWVLRGGGGSLVQIASWPPLFELSRGLRVCLGAWPPLILPPWQRKKPVGFCVQAEGEHNLLRASHGSLGNNAARPEK